METFEVYIEEHIEKYIQAYLETKTDGDVDIITALSLLRSSIEIENAELPKSSVLILDQKNSGKSCSIKLKNIKFNFRYALDMLLGMCAITSNPQVNMEMVVLMLSFIRDSFNESKILLDEEKAAIIIEIFQRALNCNETTEADIVARLDMGGKEEDVRNALDDLEKIGCIECVEAKYHICETVFMKNS